MTERSCAAPTGPPFRINRWRALKRLCRQASRAAKPIRVYGCGVLVLGSIGEVKRFYVRNEVAKTRNKNGMGKSNTELQRGGRSAKAYRLHVYGLHSTSVDDIHV